MGSSQQVKTFEWPAEELSEVLLQLPYSSSIAIENSTANTVQLTYTTEGEYRQALQLQHQISNAQLQIREQGMPSFEFHNDKLSAHKVLAATVHLRVPQQLSLKLQLEEGQLKASGQYQHFRLVQKKGRCELVSWTTAGRLRTDAVAVVLVAPKVSIQLKQKGQQQQLFCATAGGSLLQIEAQSGTVNCVPQ